MSADIPLLSPSIQAFDSIADLLLRSWELHLRAQAKRASSGSVTGFAP
jgi:hypothetical protein